MPKTSSATPAFLLWCFLLLTGLPAVASGDSSASPLSDLCSESDEILSGVVTKTRSYWGQETRGGPVEPMIFTEVTVRADERLKGAGTRRSTTFRTRGGCAEGECIVSPDIPQFATGNNVILFLRGQRSGEAKICPIVGWRRGAFYTRRDAAGREVVTRTHTGGPVTRSSSVQLDTVDAGELLRGQPDLSPLADAPLTKARFLGLIREEVDRQHRTRPSGRGSGRRAP